MPPRPQNLISSLSGSYRLYAFQQEPKKQYLRFTERKSAWSLGFGLALPADSGQVSIALSDAAPDTWYLENNMARDTFMLWITSQEVYDRDIIEAMLTYPFTDSTGTLIARTDTLSFRYTKPAVPRGSCRQKTGAHTLHQPHRQDTARH